MRNKKNNEGFSLMELLIVILIINILAAIAITLYVGVRGKARRSSVTVIALDARDVLNHWLQSSMSAKQDLRETDTNFNGVIDMNDATNGALRNNIAALFTNGRNTFKGEQSPWFDIPLWNTNDPPIPGTISLTQPDPSRLNVIAIGHNGGIITQYSVAAN